MFRLSFVTHLKEKKTYVCSNQIWCILLVNEFLPPDMGISAPSLRLDVSQLKPFVGDLRLLGHLEGVRKESQLERLSVSWKTIGKFRILELFPQKDLLTADSLWISSGLGDQSLVPATKLGPLSHFGVHGVQGSWVDQTVKGFDFGSFRSIATASHRGLGHARGSIMTQLEIGILLSSPTNPAVSTFPPTRCSSLKPGLTFTQV